MVDTIRSLAPQEGETGLDVFGKLMGGLESQLGGMGTAFSSSLLGLAGSLVLGLLELFAGHGQNRFTRELEEWLSSITRISFSGDGDSGDQSAVGAMIDHMALQVEQLHLMHEQAEAGRAAFEQRIADLSEALGRLGDRPADDGSQTAVLRRIADGQDRLIATLSADGAGGSDAESRMRLRSIDVQLLRILEEMSAGRQESMADLRADLVALTAAVRQLARSGSR